MSYKDKITNYQGDCCILLGNSTMFSDYIKEFAKYQSGDGLDLGAGPGGCNGKYFEHCENLDGCDADEVVVDSLPKDIYTNCFTYSLGSPKKLPYDDASKDFIVCSCVIQHLNSFSELELGLKEMSRVLKMKGRLFLMFKAGTNDTTFTHFNDYYKQQRTFRVFDPANVAAEAGKYNLLTVKPIELLMDDNWVPYCCMVFQKY